jgi:NAD-dependent dihydropyrimidine dehydrogenase PreA subunit
MSANPNIVWIDPDVCEKCMICVEEFGCPAIQRGVGELVPWIHGDLCNGNGSCIQVCPLGAIKRPPQARFGAGGNAPQAAGGAAVPAAGTGATPAPAAAPSAYPPGYKGGPLSGTKTDFAGRDSEVCK